MTQKREKIYYQRDLRAYLKSLGLPHSRQTLLDYEKDGTIPRPKNVMRLGNVDWRLYTLREMKNIAKIIEEKKIVKNEI